MSYVDSNLVPGEAVLYRTGVSPWAYMQHVLVSSALMAVAWYLWSHHEQLAAYVPATIAGAAVLLLMLSWSLRTANELAVTTERVIIKVGWLRVKSAMLYLSRVEGVEVNQSVVGRILGYGTVQVRGVGTEVFPVRYVQDPLRFRREIFTAASHRARGPCQTEAASSLDHGDGQ